MIVVRVELHSAIDKKVTTLCTCVIDNIGLRDEKGLRADYRCRSWKRGMELLDIRFGQKHLRHAVVQNHPRKSKHVLNLVYKALVAMGYDR